MLFSSQWRTQPVMLAVGTEQQAAELAPYSFPTHLPGRGTGPCCPSEGVPRCLITCKVFYLDTFLKLSMHHWDGAEGGSQWCLRTPQPWQTLDEVPSGHQLEISQPPGKLSTILALQTREPRSAWDSSDDEEQEQCLHSRSLAPASKSCSLKHTGGALASPPVPYSAEESWFSPFHSCNQRFMNKLINSWF